MILIVYFVALAAPDSAVERTVAELERDVRHALSTEGRASDLSNIVTRYLDVEELASYALDPQWQSLASEDRSRLVSLIRDVIVLQAQLRLRRPVDFEVRVDRIQRAGQYVAAFATLEPDSVEPTRLSVTFRQRGGAWRVVDVSVDGSSVARQYREALYDLLSRSGVSAVVNKLSKRKRELKQGRGKTRSQR
ncbi:MAG: ABC transporter substrate-binding protein [Myxococcota bacterium]